jgi:hypothetical protein
MLFNPNWKKPKSEINPHTLEGFIAWLEKQPRDRTYNYFSGTDCLIAQYYKAQGYRLVIVGRAGFSHGGIFRKRTRYDDVMDDAAVYGRGTIGGALDAAKSIMKGETEYAL